VAKDILVFKIKSQFKAIIWLATIFGIIFSIMTAEAINDLSGQQICVRNNYIAEFEQLKKLNSTKSYEILGKIYLDGDLRNADAYFNNAPEIRKKCGREGAATGKIDPEIFFEPDYLKIESIISINIALKILTMAANDKSIDALKSLAEIYELGVGVPKDQIAAQNFARKAAEAGDPDGQRLLANLYWRSGDNTSKSRINQYMWYNIAAINLKDAANDREAVAKNMSIGEVREAQARSNICIKNKFKSCEQ